MVIYILTKFGADWLIFVDARVLTRKLWMDRRRTVGRPDKQRQMVSDHNSTMSTLCSGELKIDNFFLSTEFSEMYFSPVDASNMDESKIMSSGKDLTLPILRGSANDKSHSGGNELKLFNRVENIRK